MEHNQLHMNLEQLSLKTLICKYVCHLKSMQIQNALLKKQISKKGKSTTYYQKHVPNSVDGKLVCIDDRFTQPTKIFFGSNCILTKKDLQ